MPEPEAQTKARPPRDPQALSGEYHKARKQLMLWAGILFIWELVGIDLEKAKEAGGNAGAVITSIKSPQAVPWVMLILVAYFLFKTTVEWHQCSGSRRALRVSKIDFGSAWIVTVLAYALYAYQAISRIQFADVIQGSDQARSLSVGVPAGFIFVVLIRILHKELLTNRAKSWIVPCLAFSVLLLLTLVGGLIGGIFNWKYLATGLAPGVVLGFLITYLIDRMIGVSKA